MTVPKQFTHPLRICVATVITICILAAMLVRMRVANAQGDRQLMQTTAPAASNAKRIALVIGNGGYTNAPPLKNPPNDARDMAVTLKLLGFSVSSAIDADQRTMKRLIREFGQQLKGGGQGLFYYAGHGVQMRGRNYLIPANAEITSETDVEDQGVDLNLVLGLMDEAQNGLNIVILDACRNNPFTRSFRSAGSGLAQVDAPSGTLIAYATSPGRVASDGQGRNGLYTAELLSQMRVTDIGVEEMFKRVRAGVQKETNGQQVPWESSSLVGNFYFAASSTVTTNAPAENRVTLDPNAFELSYWDTIKNSSNAEDFKAYLIKYPGGQFVELARNRIAGLQPATKANEPSAPAGGNQAEITFWDSIKNSTSADDYRAYLEKYPKGEFAVLAKNRLAPFETAEKEKSRADELARQIQTYRGNWIQGKKRFLGSLVLGVNDMRFVFDNNTDTPIGPFSCEELVRARVDGAVIREVRSVAPTKRDAFPSFEAESATAAKDAFTTLRRVCGNAPITDGKGGNALVGTIWRGGSPGGDKHYEFQFLGNGVLSWYLKWGEIDNSYPGTWRLIGNTLYIDVEGWADSGKMQATFTESQITGSWAGGSYKFTVTKIQ